MGNGAVSVGERPGVPLFTVVTPSYNQGRYIRDCIESVLQQKEVTWEHIVIDGGSTDDTIEILKQYPHLQWISEPDRGMSDAINKGFLRAKGRWVMWLNTDDYLLPGALKKVADFAEAHPEADVIYGYSYFVDESKRILREKCEHKFDFLSLLFVGCYIQSTATFIKRDIIQAGHLLDVEYRAAMDYEYYVRLTLKGYKFIYLPEPLACFRWHGDNLSLRQRSVGRSIAEVFEIRKSALKRLGFGWLAKPPIMECLRQLLRLRRSILRFIEHRKFL